jgi:hypothetical protein
MFVNVKDNQAGQSGSGNSRAFQDDPSLSIMPSAQRLCPYQGLPIGARRESKKRAISSLPGGRFGAKYEISVSLNFPPPEVLR